MRRTLKVILPLDVGTNPYLGLLADSLREEGVNVETLKTGKLPLLRLLPTLSRGDVVHLQWQHTYLLGKNVAFAVARTTFFFLQMLLLRVLGVQFVWTVHNIVNHEGRLAKWELFASRILAHSVAGVVVHCKDAAIEVAKAFRLERDGIRVVPHGHFGDAYPPPMARADARRQLGLAEPDKVILFFGQIREYKSVPSLIEAFIRVKIPSAQLLIVGDPKLPSLAENIIAMAGDEPQITLRLEHVDGATLVRFISAADVVALPYVKSLTSGASVLAATMARPIIAPRLGCMAGVPETSAIIYDGPEAGELEAALLKSFEAPLDQMGRIAADYVAEHSWSFVAKQLVGIYNEIS